MSADTHDSAHGHEKDHHPHVTPMPVYIGTWLLLMVLTIITVGVSYLDFGPGNLIIAMVIASIKATIVAAMFMHLWFDHKFHAMIIGSSIIFLGIFITFTMFDTEARGHAEAIESDRPVEIKQPFAGTKREAALKALWTPAPAGAAEHAGHGEHGAAEPH